MPRDPKDLGILFRGDMVRAILAGAKTVTRRAIRIDPRDGAFYLLDGWPHRSLDGESNRIPGMEEPYPCRFGPPGRRLWVRETWHVRGLAYTLTIQQSRVAAPGAFVYAATPPADWAGGWRPSLHMPRWASRITLRVTDVRAERLTEITAEDVALEGLVHAGLGDTPADYCRLYREMHGLFEGADPWVWRIAFEVIDAR